MKRVPTKVALKELGVSYPTLHQYCVEGMPYYRRSGPRAHYFFNIPEIKEWVENYMAHNKGKKRRAA